MRSAARRLAKYQRPCIVAETSGCSGAAPDWLNDVVCEALAAVNRGVDLHGICLFRRGHDRLAYGPCSAEGVADVERLANGALI
jgi:hypothetical protein